jgi:hypothetical protein
MQIFYMVVFVGGLVLLIDFLALCVLNNEVAQSDGIALSRRGWRTVALSLAVMLAAGVLYVFPPPDAVYSAIGLLLYPFVRLVQLVANVVGIDSDVLKNLGDTEYSSWVRESNYGWAISLTFHAFGNAAVVGLTYIIGLRFVGVFRTISFTSLLKFFPVIWLGVVVQVLSGGSLWMTKPGRYTGDSMFDTKFTLVVAGIIVTIILQRIMSRESTAWDAGGAVSARGKFFAGLAVFVWTFVLVAGRLTAYLGTLYMQ